MEIPSVIMGAEDPHGFKTKAVSFAVRHGLSDVDSWYFLEIVCALGFLNSPGRWTEVLHSMSEEHSAQNW